MRTFVAIALLITNAIAASAQNGSSSNSGSPAQMPYSMAERFRACYGPSGSPGSVRCERQSGGLPRRMVCTCDNLGICRWEHSGYC